MKYKVEEVYGFAELVRFRRDPLGYMAELSQRGTDIRCLRIGSQHLFHINHPELIQDILVNHDWNFIKGRGLQASKPVLGNGLLTSEGEVHRRERRIVQPAFHSTRLVAYAATIVECAHRMANTWAIGTLYAIDQEMMRLTLAIVGRTLFSADLEQDADDIGKSLKQALQVFFLLNSPFVRMILPVRHWAEKRAQISRGKIAIVLRKVIEAHHVHPEFDDMLSMLMRVHDSDEAAYTSEELLLDECLTLFLAGHETTANALTWTWYLLSQNPHIADRMREELEAVLDGRLPSIEDLPCLEYTERVFREALRLYPPAWVIAREAVTAYRLGEIEVRAGSTLMMSPYATHRDARFWPQPEKFDPDRWLKQYAPVQRRFAFYPFGAGTRVCIGEHFAMMEGVLLLATIAQRWKLHFEPGQQVRLWPQITLRPRQPMYFRLSDTRIDTHNYSGSSYAEIGSMS